MLRGTNSFPDAAWVYEEVRKVMPNISLATVHRTLSLLREAGFIAQTDTGDHDDARTVIHCRARCVSCGRTVDVRIDAAADLPAQAALATGFVITGHRLDLLGFCPDCAQERETNQS